MSVKAFEFDFITENVEIKAGYHFNLEVTDKCTGYAQIDKDELPFLSFEL